MRVRRHWGARWLALVLVASVGFAPGRAEAAVRPSWAPLPQDRSVPGAKAKFTPPPARPRAAAGSTGAGAFTPVLWRTLADGSG